MMRISKNLPSGQKNQGVIFNLFLNAGVYGLKIIQVLTIPLLPQGLKVYSRTPPHHDLHVVMMMD